MDDKTFNPMTYARLVLDAHGLYDWSLAWDQARRRAGSCNYSKRLITFSEPLFRLYEADTARDVVLHEVAHALAGPNQGHNAHWKAIASALGAVPKALLPPGLPKPEPVWVGQCRQCGTSKELFSMPRRVVSCGICSPKFDAAFILEWTRHGTPSAPTGAYAQELRRLQRAAQT